eukprot:Filipodium_phascolosomae@DN1503_c0_g1_i2.p1
MRPRAGLSSDHNHKPFPAVGSVPRRRDRRGSDPLRTIAPMFPLEASKRLLEGRRERQRSLLLWKSRMYLKRKPVVARYRTTPRRLDESLMDIDIVADQLKAMSVTQHAPPPQVRPNVFRSRALAPLMGAVQALLLLYEARSIRLGHGNTAAMPNSRLEAALEGVVAAEAASPHRVRRSSRSTSTPGGWASPMLTAESGVDFRFDFRASHLEEGAERRAERVGEFAEALPILLNLVMKCGATMIGELSAKNGFGEYAHRLKGRLDEYDKYWVDHHSTTSNALQFFKAVRYDDVFREPLDEHLDYFEAMDLSDLSDEGSKPPKKQKPYNELSDEVFFMYMIELFFVKSVHVFTDDVMLDEGFQQT